MKKIIFALLLSVVTLAQENKYARIDSLLNYLYHNDKFMGTIAIREGENLVFKKAYGYANQEKNSVGDGNTKYKIGSITKTFTAVLIMQMVEEGKLKLSDKLSKFYPNVSNSKLITIEHLLHHRTGIVDYLNGDSTIGEVVFKENTKQEIIQRIENYKPLFDVDSKYEYSNSNYYLLGGILEQISSQTFAELIKQKIADKIGLKYTYYPTNIKETHSDALSYMYNGEKWMQIPEWDTTLAFAAGGMVSTPSDLTLFLRALHEGKLVKKSTFSKMKEFKNGYGKALMQFPFGERKFVGHTGGIENFRAVVGYYPGDNLGISLIVNGDNYNRNDIMLGVLSIYYQMPYPFPSFEKLSLEDLQSFLGYYSSKDLPLMITITEKNGQLLAQATGQPSFPLTFDKGKRFVYASAGIEIEFEENGFTLKQGGVKYKYTQN